MYKRTEPVVWNNEDGTPDTADMRQANRLAWESWEALVGRKRVPVDEEGVPLIGGPGVEVDCDGKGKALVIEKNTKPATKIRFRLGD
jgi:hypothetical protein